MCTQLLMCWWAGLWGLWKWDLQHWRSPGGDIFKTIVYSNCFFLSFFLKRSSHCEILKITVQYACLEHKIWQGCFFKVAPACLELTQNREGEYILVAIVCHVEENLNEELTVEKCCPHGQQLAADHRSCRSHNGKGSLPPRWMTLLFVQGVIKNREVQTKIHQIWTESCCDTSIFTGLSFIEGIKQFPITVYLLCATCSPPYTLVLSHV